MRLLAGLATAFGVSGCVFAAAGAAAQTAPDALEPGAAQLMGAAFARGQVSDPGIGASRASQDPITDLLDRQAHGAHAIRWSDDQAVSRASDDGASVSTLHLSIGGQPRTAGGVPLALDRAELDTQVYELRLTRDWPAAVSFAGDRYGVDLTPHAGFGVSSDGGSAEAGATLTLAPRTRDEGLADGLDRLGLHDGARLGDRGRWYVFAAASGRAMGLNMLKDARGWDRAWSQDSSSTLIGDAQLGVGWRRGAMQTSFGYIHREVKGDHMLWGTQAKDDSMVAFSLAIKPRR